ncbi:hypothetical protein, partial [Legionella sp.]|uniref:hypothetical protein n=1 Tax=Legionella sp. TaxID=459 RepID=UPI00321F82A5
SSPPTKQEECFARYLGISLELFCQSNQITALHGLTSNLEEAKQRQLAAIKAILIIQKQLHLKEGVADYFLSLLKRAQSTDALRELLKAENLNEAFFIEFLQHPLCDSTLIENLLSSKHELSDQHLNLMLQRCDSEECFNQCMDKLLQKATIGDEVLTVLLKRKEINEKQLVDLVLRAQTTEALAQISQYPAASDEVQEAILLHSQCSSELFTAIINRGLLKPLTAEVAFKVLRVFGQQAIPLLPVREMADLANENDIDLMINQIGSVPSNNSKTHFLFKDLIKKCFAQLALSNNPRWENRLLQIAQKYPVDSDLYKEVINFICEHPLSERLALKLLLHGGHAVADALPFEEAFLIADESEVKILLNAFHSSPLSEECLIKLVKKTKDLEIMQSILQREVGHNVLQAILNKNLDYPTLQLVLTHKQFSKEKQRAWLDHLADTQTTLQEKAQSTAHPDKALIASLHALKVKACHHAVRALTDEAYKDVAQASFDLYGTLRQEIEQFFQAPCYPSEFIRECSKEVEKSRGILATHRGGIGQLLIDILSAILAVATLKFIRSDSHKWDFFETKTASLQIVEELQVNIKRCAQEATQNQSRQTSNSEPSSTTPYPHQRNRFFYQAGQESWEQSQFVPVVSY